MDNLLEEYKAYYALRAERFANNPNYSNSYKAEKDLSEAMQSCNTLDEFKERMGNKNELCAIALAKDEYIIEKQFFEKHQEKIRQSAAENILAGVDNYDNVMDLISFITETENKNSIKISMDESNRMLIEEWSSLDTIEMFENAVVPDKYKNDMLNSAKNIKEEMNERVKSLEENNDAWEPGWRLQPDVVLEYRHKRLLPYKDEHINEQLSKFKSIINR